MGKAVTALSVTAFALANVPEVFARFTGGWALPCVFAGALMFLLGYLLYGALAPPEFRPQGEIWDHVGRMTALSDHAFFTDRQRLSQQLVSRFGPADRLPPDVSGALFHLDNKLGALPLTAGTLDWREAAAGLFHADLDLRQYDAPRARLAVAATLGAGLLLLLAPTLSNVLRALLP